MEKDKAHWEEIYSENNPDEVSWFQNHPTASLRFIESSGVGKDQAVIDVGGGASILVDHLIDHGFSKVSVLDLSAKALQRSKDRLGPERANHVDWIVTDVREFRPKQRVSLWHDRAVLHFLTQEVDRQSYLRTVKESLTPHGHLIVATFAIGGPKQCSGLDIVQYDAESLTRFFGDSFELKESEFETHRTPWKSDQMFVYCRFQRRAADGRTHP
jgi:ubiquinone/menaquinone biosynthesis C-methylase UbiE